MLYRTLTVSFVLWLVCVANTATEHVLTEMDDVYDVTTPSSPGSGQLSALLKTALSSPNVKGLLAMLPPDVAHELQSGNLTAIQSLMSSPLLQGLLSSMFGGGAPATNRTTSGTSSPVQALLNSLNNVNPKSIQTLLSSPVVQGALKSLPPDISAALMSGNLTAIGTILSSPTVQGALKLLPPDVSAALMSGNLTAIGTILSSPQLQSIMQSMITGGGNANPMSGLLSGGLQDFFKNVISDTDGLKYFKVSDMCVQDFKRITEGLSTRQIWAMQMVDAMGKLDAGFLSRFSTRKKLLGDYDECYGITAAGSDGVEYFKPKFCRSGLSIITDQLLPQLKGQTIYVGTCVSARCDANDIDGLMKTAQHVLFNQSFMFWPTSDCVEDQSLDKTAIAVICVLSVLGVCMVIGTMYDVIVVQMELCNTSDPEKSDVELTGMHNISYVKTEEPGEKMNGTSHNGTSHNGISHNGIADGVSTQPLGQKKDPQKRSVLGQLILSFSVYTNGVKILNTHQGSGSLGAINGIRFLSMAWVILGHTYFFANGYDENLYTMFGKKSQQWTFMFIPYATVSVDSFFALSGILVAYLTLRELKKVGGAPKFNWLMYYFHRFWRLTPPYMLLLMVGTVIVPYLSDGPMWSKDDNPLMGTCRDNWWTNLLYISNYVKTSEMCMGWSWYLANDMQFYIISPLILIPLFYYVGAGVAVGSVLTVASWIATGVVAAHHHYPAQQGLAGAPEAKDGDYMKNIYFPSYARIGPYIVGLFTGYLLYRMKCKCRIPKLANLAAWLVCIGTCCAIIYSPFNDDGKHVMGLSESAAYMTLSRTAWAGSVCWIVFSCACGYGGWINELLSWKAFIPLGRLTYCAYLVHPLCMNVYAASLRVPYYFTDYSLTYLFFGNIVTAYAVAFVSSLAFESPMMALEKAVFHRGKK